MTTLREAAQQALDALKMMRDQYEEYACPACDHADAAIYALKEALVEDAMQKFTDVNQELEAALAEPTLSQQLAAAGFTRRDTRLECDECGGKFTRQMLPIHKCEPVQEGNSQDSNEPMAWIHTDPNMPRVKFLEWRENEPGYRGDWIKTPLYAAPPQRLPLTDDQLDDIAVAARRGNLYDLRIAIERAHEPGDNDD